MSTREDNVQYIEDLSIKSVDRPEEKEGPVSFLTEYKFEDLLPETAPHGYTWKNIDMKAFVPSDFSFTTCKLDKIVCEKVNCDLEYVSFVIEDDSAKKMKLYDLHEYINKKEHARSDLKTELGAVFELSDEVIEKVEFLYKLSWTMCD